jgi:hypothetical protein
VKLKKEKYEVSAATLEMVMNALAANWFRSDGEDEWNNDDVIDADNALRAEVEAQEQQ